MRRTKDRVETKAQSQRRYGPQPPVIELSEAERQELETLLKGHSTAQQIGLRARIVLLAAAGYNHSEIARELAISLDMARLWRARYLSLQANSELRVSKRLADLPRAGRKAGISPEQVCELLALACEKPAASGRAISQWRGSELADEAIRRGIVNEISARHVSRLLKRGLSNRILSATG